MITQGRAAVLRRICRMMIAASLAGTLMLWLIPAQETVPPVVVGAANYGFKITPIQYPSFDALTLKDEDPFDFKREVVRKKSFVVKEKKSEPVKARKPAPGPDVRGLLLLATSPHASVPTAIVKDSASAELLTLKKGDDLRQSRVKDILDTCIVLTRNGQDIKVGWEDHWQSALEKMNQGQ